MSVAGRRDRQILLAGAALALAAALAACAPRRPYRAPVPPGRVPTTPSQQLPPPSAPPETVSKPLPPDPKIREQDLKTKAPSVLPPSAKEPERRPAPDSAVALPPPLADDSSLLAKITPGVSPQRAASLRLTDEGSKLLDAGEPAKALARLERTIVIDATNPYGYFYLAKAQYRLGRYGESLNFLAVAESRLSAEPFWLAEVHALRGENYRAQGHLQRAEASYQQALRLNSGNRTANNALARLHVEPAPASR
jgi:hypothetical protein